MKSIFSWILAVTLAAIGTSVVFAQAPKPEYAVAAFGGLLTGTDRGEWIGRLQFTDAAGKTHSLLEENVLDIVKNEQGIFVFTGLLHVGLNEGALYAVKRDTHGVVGAQLVNRLPGAPSQIHLQPDGRTSFLVFTGKFDVQQREIYKCYSLTGNAVSRGSGC
ncbi:hypothetical protein [Xanthomonas dyei]|uniref:hypothetical protein n=1 Tax=Xanthomonas dyei TaxID=743699 RepID=UPI001E40F64E|nr:hypothetical protein [Xanthomonas dyei]MCC4631995.1 hypothetical protein [Xanthomonas dyei pv. eucalypti]